MITPKFTISQNDEFVIITVKMPYIRMSALEIIAEDCNFSLYCKPYLLKLTFACQFKEEDEECKATYDPFSDNGTLIAYLPKLNHGEHFPDLDLTTSLLQLNKKKSTVAAGAEKVNSIEVLSSEDFAMEENDEEDAASSLPSPFLASGLTAVTYGFNNMYSRVFTDLRDEMLDMTEIKHPDQIRPHYRSVLRVSAENQQFDPARYLGDQLDGEMDPIYAEAMPFRPFYSEQWETWKSAKKLPVPEVLSPHTPAAASELNGTGEPEPESPTTEGQETAPPGEVSTLSNPSRSQDPRDVAFDTVGGFSDAEKDTLATKLPNKEYLIAAGSREQECALLGLVDILFAFCYDHRITLGEGNVESAHTMARLSCTLSWLEDYSLMQPLWAAGDKAILEERVGNVIKFNLRRCIIFPYLRVWKLARKVLADVAKILFLGKRAVLKCLLQLHNTFEHTDTHYLLNKVYIGDYCVWVQNGLASDQLQAFAKLYNNAKGSIEKMPHTGKELMGLYLPEMEEWEKQQEMECDDEDESEEDSESSSDESSESESESESEEEEEEGESPQDGSASGVSTLAGAVNESASAATATAPTDELFIARADILPAPSDTTSTKSMQNLSAEPLSGVQAEGEEEWTVPAEFTDYEALQQRDPLLKYLAISTLDPSFHAALHGDATMVAPVAPKSAALNDMLLMPKRKAEAELEALIAGPSGVNNTSKCPLIEEIAPRGPLITELPEASKSLEPAKESEPVASSDTGIVESALSSRLEKLDIEESSK